MPPVADGTPETISGHLRIPESTGQIPAVIITHGCGGITGAENGWANRLYERGIATFIVHSFGARHIPGVCTGQHQINIATVLADTFAALELLADHPRIDSERIAILGLSFGGRTALWTAHLRFYEQYGDDNRFAAHLALYPSSCYIRLADETEVSGSPMRIFHGTADDWTPIDQCRAYVERLQDGGIDIEIYEYTEALHSFDDPTTPFMSRPLSLSPRNCTFVEQDGRILDPDTGQEAGIGSPCVTRGVTLGYNAIAEQQVIADVDVFLQSVFK